MRTNAVEPERVDFARRLNAAMRDKGVSNSDLARAVWGTTKDAKGYEVAKNRHQVALYLKGEAVPTPASLHKIAEALGVSKEDLAPHATTAVIDRKRPELAMAMVSGHKAHLQINAVLPLKAVTQIIAIFQQATARDTDESDPVAMNGHEQGVHSAEDHSQED